MITKNGRRQKKMERQRVLVEHVCSGLGLQLTRRLSWFQGEGVAITNEKWRENGQKRRKTRGVSVKQAAADTEIFM
jgi:hypothetical protein